LSDFHRSNLLRFSTIRETVFPIISKDDFTLKACPSPTNASIVVLSFFTQMDNGSQPQLPERLWDLPFLDRGISGIVFAIDDFSVIKTPAGGVANVREFEVERRIFERLGEHPRIVKMLYIYKDMLVLERLLYPLRVRTLNIRERRLVPSTEEILKWSAQTAEGTQYLHENKIFQVDIGLQ